MEEPDFDYFQAIPWCNTFISNPAYKTTTTLCRTPKPVTGEYLLFGKTFRTNDTIPHCLSIFKIPIAPSKFTTELHTFLTLGSDLNGGANLLHGGVIATLLDDAMGLLLDVNKQLGDVPEGMTNVTASLEVKYKRPVPTPATVVVSVLSAERKGRKCWLNVAMRNEKGEDLATATALWVLVKGANAKL